MGLKSFLWIKLRLWKYRTLSSAKNVRGIIKQYQPVLLSGEGDITIGTNVCMGVIRSPHFYSGYSYIEARTVDSTIKIEDNVHINNNCTIISNGASIRIESDTLIGYNCHIYDSDFHDLRPQKRLHSIGKTGNVHIKRNVFLGNNVTILKGVVIGENSVVGSNSIVTKDIPDNTIVAGNPAQIIGTLHDTNVESLL